MHILVIGGDSAIGGSFIAAPRAAHLKISATTRRPQTIDPDRIYLDLADDRAVASVRLPRCDVAFFCAAVDGFAMCRANPVLARLVSIDSTAILVERLAAQGTHVVLLSSTAVFDFQTPQVKADTPTCPRTLHGELKAEAEELFLRLGIQGSVLRLTKVLTPDAALVARWIAALRRNEPVFAFSDLHIAPLSLADATLAMLAVTEDRGGGIYQMSGARDVNYLDVASHLAKMIGSPHDLVRPTRAIDCGIPPAEIPRFTTLDCSRLKKLTGQRPPDPFTVIEMVYASQVSPAGAGA
jgi:dTDP-4-dehydrorhamnose reductase